jgi:hypothetical protein
MAKRVGQVLLTYEVLAKMAGLDPEHQIVAIVPQTATDIANQRFGVLVTGPSLPTTPEGGCPVTVSSFAEMMKHGQEE